MLLLLNRLLFAELLLSLLLYVQKNKYANKIVKVWENNIHYLLLKYNLVDIS